MTTGDTEPKIKPLSIEGIIEEANRQGFAVIFHANGGVQVERDNPGPDYSGPPQDYAALEPLRARLARDLWGLKRLRGRT